MQYAWFVPVSEHRDLRMNHAANRLERVVPDELSHKVHVVRMLCQELDHVRFDHQWHVAPERA